MIARRQLLLSSLLLATATPAFADPPPGKGKNKHQPENDSRSAAGRLAGAAVFSPLEMQRIRGYYAARPGVGGKPLPPGIAKNLARGKPLPPGIANATRRATCCASCPVAAATRS